MNSDDAEMAEVEYCSSSPVQSEVMSSSYGSEEINNMLRLARQLIDQGKASQALQAVMIATRLRGGDEAVSRILHRARHLYMNKIRSSAAADELAAMFAECAIAEAATASTTTSTSEHMMDTEDTTTLSPQPRGNNREPPPSILAETGRQQIVVDAFADGSSFICLRCGGLISNQRKDEHVAEWCSEL